MVVAERTVKHKNRKYVEMIQLMCFDRQRIGKTSGIAGTTLRLVHPCDRIGPAKKE